MKETTVVIYTGMKGKPWEPAVLERDLGEEVAACLGTTLLEGGSDYCITRDNTGQIIAVFYDTRPDADAWTAKVTMTALVPGDRIEIRYWNRVAGIMRAAEAKTWKKTANSAGIFEAKLPLEGADLLLIRENQA